MQRYAKGDTSAFDMLYARHKDALYRYLLRSCNSEDAVSALFQDVWRKLIHTRGQYKPNGRFIQYLFGLAHKRLADHFRSQRIEPVFSSEPSDPAGDQTDSSLDRQQQSQRLMAAVGHLPLDQREAFLLREEGGFSLEEIATITGTDSNSAKRRLGYAVTSLGRSLDHAEF